MSEFAMTWEQAVELIRSQPQAAELVRACFFDDPILTAAKRFVASSEWLATRKLLQPRSGLALDLGAGRGIASYALAVDGWTVSSLEPDPSPLVGAGAIRELASEAGLQIQVVQEWGESLPFASDRFDLVLCRQVLHHARDLRQLCKQIERVLRPGGVMVATREHVISKNEDLPAFQAAHPLHKHYGGEHAYLLSEYHAAIAAAGLKLRKTLNPWQSDINLYPATIDEYRQRLAANLRCPVGLVRPWMLTAYAACSVEPGRLYTFVAIKP